ncbi:MAG: type III pantothenate kinase [Acidimicrobiales bacterium]|nr:type III pantothenate kinase [Acidimicrobiales bacterium]
MLLAIDAGNTQTVVGLLEGDGGELVHHWRISTNADRTADELGLLVVQMVEAAGCERTVVTGVVVSSTVPRVQTALREMVHRWFEAPLVVVEPGVRTGVPILYDGPVGADRIANAVAAVARHGAPAIVVDFGTATTFDVISKKGEYLGGVIVPGIEISLDALYAHASLLRRVELVEPRGVIGRSTVESIQAGVLYGYAEMADGLCRRIQYELGPCTVVGTGGLAALMVPYSQAIEHHDPWLTLRGLGIIFDRNGGTT